MVQKLSLEEARVLGCMMEKSVVTPDQYPMTLNSLTNACNQKSARNPVMSMEQGVVLRTIRELTNKKLIRTDENFKSRVEKYQHRFCNTPFSDYQFDAAQFAIVCLLLLRGPQTPGELRSRSGRLHTFSDNAAVVDALASLIEREGDALLVQLPRTPGRKDAEYMHLFCGPIDIEAHANQALSEKTSMRSLPSGVAELELRVDVLEAKVVALGDQLSILLSSSDG
ncbi:MAG: YceH family protein [Pseudomonadales bacterium]|nr:YceH family protein [Pseudomonadales bacterium]